MARHLGQGILIDNKPGPAGGVVGLEAAPQHAARRVYDLDGQFHRRVRRAVVRGKQPLLPQMAPVSILTTVPT